MAGGTKEDEKNERIIRRLLKLSENKRCINCNSLGPQYVCTTFWTFVCTNCSGIHREFTHRVKSISMAKFTSEEVNALQEGGNQRAKDIYFKGLDQERQPGFDSSNLEGLRNFIRQVYVNKRYTGEKIDDKTPRGQMGDKNDYNETRSSGGSRSPPYGDAYNRRSSRRSNPSGKSNKSPSRPEFVNDWCREDRFGSARKSEEGIHSPEQVKGMGSSSPPVVRPVSEILGDNVVPLRVGEPPKPHVNTNADASTYTKGAPSSNNLTSTNENLPEVKLETAVISLIDFDADPEPPAPAVAVHALQSRPAAQPANDNWAFFDAASTGPSVIVSQSPPSGNTVDSLLSQLAMPSSMPVQTSSLASESLASMDITNVHQQSPSLLPLHLDHSTSQNFAPPSSEQPWNTTLASNVPREASPLPLEGLQSSGRSELSADLFAVTYPSYNAAESGWQVGPPHGMHFGMQQYNNTVQTFKNLNFPQPAKSMNPFDFSSEPPSKTQTETLFPSMASLQRAVPNTLPPLDMMPSQGLHNPSSLPPQIPGLAPAMPPRYISPQMPGTMPPSNINPIGNMGASYDHTQQTSHLIGSPFGAAIPTFPSGGNPFG